MPDTPVTRDPGQAGRIDGLRILLVENHRELQQAVRRLLEQAGASVETAADGSEAVARASAEVFDVVLMDLRMPNVDGVQATRLLRGRGNTVPIVALTADGQTLPRSVARDIGFNDCLVKPFTVEALLSSIRDVRQPGP